MNILIVYALEEERGDWSMPGHTLNFCPTGVGKVSAAIRTLQAIQLYEPDLVMNVGTAGTLHHQVGDVLLCSQYVDRDLEKIAAYGVPFKLDCASDLKQAGIQLKATGVVSTGDTFQESAEDSSEGSHADVFDMEGFAIAQACKMTGRPLLSVKFVTDVIGQNSIKHWEEKLADARQGLSSYLKTLKL